MPRFVPISQNAMLDLLAERVRALRDHTVIAIDGADAAHPVELAHRAAEVLRQDGRQAEVVSVHDYVRPAALRMEFGVDETSYRTAWFDYAAIRREVVDAMHDHGRWLPRLWDERTDRSARDTIRSARPCAVILVAGPMLLGRELGFDLSVRLDLSEPALRRATPTEDRWTLGGLLAHEAEPTESPTLFLRWDHPTRPALRQS
ncbi:nucleoside/nucleotide kinase family protein [Nocardia callitridis]|uniref:Uridine kinase n=1 Tax=Nocardia callitridis TaxID=648753 RepID=A0ABP9KDG7_9NOCA